MNKLDIIIENIELYNRLKRDIILILNEYEEAIKNKINDIKEREKFEENKKTIVELFLMQERLDIIKNRLNFTLSDYLYNFIYEFDRHDDESILYLIDKILNKSLIL